MLRGSKEVVKELALSRKLNWATLRLALAA
jgi:hypothetical protein